MITLGRSHGCYLKAISDRKSRRHDEDDMMPRSLDEIFDLNRAVAKKMEDVFVKKGIPVVPSLGVFFCAIAPKFEIDRSSFHANREQRCLA